ncbi:MAG: coproporphyrinogen dehydrogenase HemZ [Clostridiales bacterium]|jgi:oxygen-independent coproporphyrinogen-3 oxidase|nr:coproporphyrinogen dehydrogenase HemZ [Clostridiales bacterium]
MTVKPWGNLVGVRPTKPLHSLLDRGLSYEDALEAMQGRYGISRDKFDLLWQVANTARPVLAESSDPALFSVYVGIPFCPSRCLYCSFPSHSLTDLGKYRSQFVESLIHEISETGRQTAAAGMRPFTVYIGGGTPTALEPEELNRVLTSLRESFPGVWREFTVEAGRPETITDDHFQVIKQNGVERISINPQTMHSSTLALIGRKHSPDDVISAVKKARNYGIEIVNMDVIIGLPGEDAGMVEETANQILALQPENITMHVFARKRASRFNDQQIAYSLPDASEATEMHSKVTEMVNGTYQPYYLYRQRDILGGLENIGYTLPDHQCLYNILMIEERHNIIGLGGGATSKFVTQDVSLTNISTPKDVRIYLERIPQLIERRGVEIIKQAD